jgi:hypothetical protein
MKGSFAVAARSLFFELITATVAITLSPMAPAQSVSFAATRDFPVGQSPTSVAVGDFKGDGKLDIVTASAFSSNTISVLVGNGDGTFQPAASYGAGTNPIAVWTGDFNGDGKLDILTVNSDSSVSVLLGNGNGTFQSPVVTSFVSNDPKALTVGDFNGDGKLDLAMPVSVPQVGDCALVVMLGKGDGTFAPAGAPSAGPVPIPDSMVAADINGDGKLDLVAVAVVGVNVTVFLGNGDGTFQTALNSPTGISSAFLAVADFNGDGIPDVVLSGSSGLAVLLGKGDGTFGPAILASSNDSGQVFVGDLNGDGKADIIAVAEPSGGIGVLLGNGDGTFQPLIGTLLGTVVGEGTSLALGDFNGDGKSDVVSIGITPNGASPVVSVSLGKGDGTFLLGTEIQVSCVCFDAGGAQSILVGDLNGDGKSDLVYLQTFPAFGYVVATLLGNGDGTFATPVTFGMNGYLFGTANVAAGDFNNDGKLDLAITAGHVGVFLGKGDGTFQPEVDYGGQNAVFVAVADFNGDGKADLVTADATANTVSVLLGNGDGTFGFAKSFPVGNAANSLVVGDFNNDGNPDVAVATGNSVAVLLGNGDGTFGTAVQYNAGAGGTNVAAGDLNHDGNLDLVVSNSSSNYISVLLGKGDGTFSAPVNINVGSSPTWIAISDFNLDGKQDIAVLNPGWGDIAILLGNGDGTFQAAQYFGTGGYSLGSFTVGDLNGDGAPDIANTGILLLLNQAAVPGAVLSSRTVAFGNQGMGIPSSAQTVTVSNTGAAALNIASITISGAQSSDFAEMNNCGTTLAIGANCTVSITFTPSALGTRTANIQIADNAYNTPQIIGVGGVGIPTLKLGVASGSSGSATVPAGQPASYTLAIGGGGLGGTATLTCTGAPKGATCSVPASVNVNAASASTFTVSVTTTPRTLAALPSDTLRTGWWAIAIFGFVILPGAVRRGRWTLRLLPLALLLMIGSCGGGNSSSGPQPNPNGTPVGTSILTVTATSGSTSQSIPLTLNVQ